MKRNLRVGKGADRRKEGMRIARVSEGQQPFKVGM